MRKVWMVESRYSCLVMKRKIQHLASIPEGMLNTSGDATSPSFAQRSLVRMTATDLEQLMRFVFFFVAVTLTVRGETTRRTFLEGDIHLGQRTAERRQNMAWKETRTAIASACIMRH